MRWEPIVKSENTRKASNLGDYERARREFTWEQARSALSGLPRTRGLNIAYEAVDRHAFGESARACALRWIDKHDEVTRISYGELRELTNRFANVLHDLGITGGERVYTLLGRIPALYVSVLGTLKAGGVVAPLFSAFGPEPVAERLRIGEGAVLVTTPRLYRNKISQVRAGLPHLRHVLLVGEGEAQPGTVRLEDALAHASPTYEIAATAPEDAALLHFTSGTTGSPKGAVHVHDAVVAHHATAYYGLDLRPDDVFWCTADPGWVTGTSYGIVAPLTHGATLVSDEGEFDARRWYRVLSEQRVTVWYTAPTALRMLMRHGSEPASRYDLSALRYVASVGEPLNPEVVVWAQDALGMPVHDNWWQTETGAIMISNFPGEEVRPGSMGRPLPGIEAGLLERGDDGRARVDQGRVREMPGADAEGELALRPGWPSMFRGTCTTTPATRRLSPTAGTSPATSPHGTPTATTGSSAGPTT
ncbi:AMP-binding protein [Saccharopolyspora spinosporotrichia]